MTTVAIKNAGIITLTPGAEWQRIYAAARVNEPVQIIVKFSKQLSQNEWQSVKNNVVDGSHLPDGLYTGILTGTLPAAILPFAHIAEVKPEWKVDNYLWKMAASTSNSIEIVAGIDTNIGIAEVKQKLFALGGKLKSDHILYGGNYQIVLPAKKLKELAQWYAVLYISPLSADEPLDIESQYSAKANIAGTSSVFNGFGLTGSGVAIGVGDNVSGDFHIDLKDRIINYNPVGYTNHGVHINGIVGGAGIIDHKGEGIAPKAILIDHLYSSVWDQLPEMYETYNMTLTNNSYASVVGDCNYAGTYDLYSQALDQLAIDYPDVLQVFAAGNDGYLDCSPYPQGFGTVNGGFQPAKNTIVVTSTDKKYVNATDGSRGPVKDGRLKPEMTAVGVDVYSTTKSEQYLVAGGTSMACPEVTGALALLTERYRQLHSNTNAKNDVLKALILNGTMDIGNPGPDYRFGFGFLNLYRSLLMLNNDQYYTNTLISGQKQTRSITVPANTAQLKVMLCWNDKPANPMAASQLVNDLDITVTEPNATIHYPLILDPSPANILSNAVEGLDRRNNCEQIIINNPAAGDYTATVTGFNIPSGDQRYVVCYDVIPLGVMLGFPYNGAQVKANDSVHVYWDASENSNPFTLEYSVDNGAQWNVLNDNIPADQRYYVWHVADSINSGMCRMRITRNNTSQTYTTGNFAVNIQPELELDLIQCPGYMRVKWNAIPFATSYEVMRKIGPEMRVIDTVTTTSYTLPGLSPDSIYYVAVRPIIDGMQGYRSLAIGRQPKDGSCAGNISDGDLRADAIISSPGGRKYTSSELTNHEKVTVSIQNLDDAPINYYRISYKFNNSTWQSFISNTPVPALGKWPIEIGSFDMSAPGTYSFKIAVTNLLSTDVVNANDTVVKIIRQLNNEPISVSNSYLENFEGMDSVAITRDALGISPDEHWDYYNSSDSGRLRSYINKALSLNGNRSVSMDEVKNRARTQNELIGTFNLENYKVNDDEIRMEFKYRLHGMPDSLEGNEVWVRGSDMSDWQSIFIYKPLSTDIGNILNSGTLSVTDGLLAGSQQFSSSFQVKFGQRDSSLIAGPAYGCGLTIDDIELYTVQNDVQINSIATPGIIECGLNAQSPFTVNLYNSVNQEQQNVSISYRIDNGEVVTEIIRSIKGKQKLQYTFNNAPDMSKTGKHKLDVWLNAEGDTYHKNDSVLNYIFYNQPLITTFPYRQSFEENDGNWFAEGVNASWEWGIPNSPKINRAAEGNKAWITNLDGNYNDNEISYLYSPCFDLTNAINPVLSFQTVIDIENCGIVLCDGAYVEYSKDGTKWSHLGKAHKGINWYNDTLYNIWTEQGNTNWYQASFTLPALKTIVKLRFSFFSDIAGSFEGIGIDDVEISDNRLYPEKQLLSISPNPTIDGRIAIEWTGNSESKLDMVMTDITGKEVFRTYINSSGNYNKSVIQTSKFATGMYFMKIHIDGVKYVYKIIYQ